MAADAFCRGRCCCKPTQPVAPVSGETGEAFALPCRRAPTPPQPGLQTMAIVGAQVEKTARAEIGCGPFQEFLLQGLGVSRAPTANRLQRTIDGDEIKRLGLERQ